ncbi:PREDICTED: replication protein A 70 kDa DNA-binding subunit B-like [Nicotiana attenuata]|uniref:replication protein A 70 kDa DNA-binding subunit B-like n=1 Tax=Nicotiana attenuata TaxID=49451 RepID=UPI000905A113|nr:PREDICTED: replication protein A 70 kDa DNA-binding subunit B-like [Nicotiana attenuata]
MYNGLRRHNKELNRRISSVLRGYFRFRMLRYNLLWLVEIPGDLNELRRDYKELNKCYIEKMEERLSISEITPLTTEWTCKVQTVDKFWPRDSRDQRVHFQTIIVQDVNEEQICVILYGDDIKRCDNLFELFETYLISTVKVRNPQPYSLHIGQFEWIVDRFTIIESIPKTNEKEAPLPPPSRLSAISFADVEQQPSGVEFDLLAVVANCGVMQYTADQTKRFQEAIVMDNTKKPLFFTIWEDLASNEGIELPRQVRQLQEYPVILAKRIVSRLATRYNSTILINPLYVQATELRNWVDKNKEMLIEYTVKSSAESASSLNLVAVDDEILSISSIATQTSGVSSVNYNMDNC